MRGDVPQHPEVWGELCGRYPVAVPLSDVRIKAFLGAGFQVFVRAGRLHLRFLSPILPLYRGFLLHPDDENDPYAFRIEFSGLGMATIPMQVVFSRDPDTGAVCVHLDLQSVSAEKLPARTHPGRWIIGALTRTAAAVAGSRQRSPHRPQETPQAVTAVPGDRAEQKHRAATRGVPMTATQTPTARVATVLAGLNDVRCEVGPVPT